MPGIRRQKEVRTDGFLVHELRMRVEAAQLRGFESSLEGWSIQIPVWNKLLTIFCLLAKDFTYFINVRDVCIHEP